MLFQKAYVYEIILEWIVSQTTQALDSGAASEWRTGELYSGRIWVENLGRTSENWIYSYKGPRRIPECQAERQCFLERSFSFANFEGREYQFEGIAEGEILGARNWSWSGFGFTIRSYRPKGFLKIICWIIFGRKKNEISMGIAVEAVG